MGILYSAQRGWKLRWPLMAESRLQERGFSWRNLFVFLSVNVFVLVPGVIVYLVYCTVLAADHFSEGFVMLHPDGLTVQARRYVRNDGKTIQLFPMSHVGETDFYQKLSKSFPTNSTILMEGVTDDRNLLTNKITYKRMAASLGVAEQQREFRPRGQLVRADVDVEQFATSTIDFLNAVTLVHSKGLNAQTMLVLIQYSPPLILKSICLTTCSESATDAYWKKSKSGFRSRNTSPCHGERPTCRESQERFSNPAFVWSKRRSLWRSDFVPLEIQTGAMGKQVGRRRGRPS